VIRSLSRLAVATVLLVGAPAWADPYPVAVLQGMDKVTARVTPIRVAVNETGRFGTLEITVYHCDKRPPEEPPESAAFLDIRETRGGEAPTELFRGWMFASSPGHSAMEHPVYDVWVLDCESLVPPPSTSSSAPSGRSP
jgi:hypothetical protein